MSAADVAANAGKKVVDNNDADDDEDAVTDTSCLEVPMIDYYKIRHEVSDFAAKINQLNNLV